LSSDLIAHVLETVYLTGLLASTGAAVLVACADPVIPRMTTRQLCTFALLSTVAVIFWFVAFPMHHWWSRRRRG